MSNRRLVFNLMVDGKSVEEIPFPFVAPQELVDVIEKSPTKQIKYNTLMAYINQQQFDIDRGRTITSQIQDLFSSEHHILNIV